MEREIQKIASKELFSMIEELLAEGRQAAFTVTGMSMWPFLCHGRVCGRSSATAEIKWWLKPAGRMRFAEEISSCFRHISGIIFCTG